MPPETDCDLINSLSRSSGTISPPVQAAHLNAQTTLLAFFWEPETNSNISTQEPVSFRFSNWSCYSSRLTQKSSVLKDQSWQEDLDQMINEVRILKDVECLFPSKKSNHFLHLVILSFVRIFFLRFPHLLDNMLAL